MDFPGFPPLALAALLLAGCTAPADAPQAQLEPGARVRFLAPDFDRGARTGVVGQVGDCTVLMVGDGSPRPRRFDVVPVDDLRTLEVSTRFDGRPGPDGTPRAYEAGADTAGESWRPLSLAAIQRRYGGCARGGQP